MGFYDNYNFDGLKFLANIKLHPEAFISEPCPEFLSAIKKIKSNYPPSRNITVAEIGIGFGATTLQALKALDENDVYYAFDFEHNIRALEEDLQARDFGIKCQLITKSNSTKQFDSYNWNLSNMVFGMRARNEAGIFDAVYLDGAHTFFHDGLAVCLLKELVKDDGFLILDDIPWSYAEHHPDRELGFKLFPKEQAEDKQIFRVQELFLSNDPNFEKLSSPKDWRGVFHKRPRLLS